MLGKKDVFMHFILTAFLVFTIIGCETHSASTPPEPNVSGVEASRVEVARSFSTVNLALNMPAVASSVQKAGLEAKYAFDGNATTRWSSLFSDPQWIYVDLGVAQAFNHVELNWEDAAAKYYQIRVSNDAKTWATVYSTKTGAKGPITILFNTVNARYVQMYATSRTTTYGCSLWEFEVYNDVVSAKDITEKFEAEDWDAMSGLQTETCTDIGDTLDVGWTTPGDWLEYRVSITDPGPYTVDFRVSDAQTAASFDVSIDGAKITTVNVPVTRGWQNWTTVNGGVFLLPEGIHTLRLTVVKSGFNINWFQWSVPSPEVTSLTVIACDSAVNLSWTPPLGFSVVSTQVTYTPGGQNPISVREGINTIDIPGLSNGTNYTFTVKSEYRAGTFAEGTQISATPFLPPAPPDGPVSKYGRLKIVGSQLCDQNGVAVQLKGMSAHQLQNYPFAQGTVGNLVGQYGTSLVRAAMYVEENGYADQPDIMFARERIIIESAIANDIYVLVDWHHHGDPNVYSALAMDFFNKVVTRYGDCPNIIYEIINEPKDVDWAGIKKFAEKVIPVIRAKAPNSIIVCGTPNFDTRPQDVINNRLNFKNIAYTLHFYCGNATSETSGQSQRDNVSNLIKQKLAIFVTEWGASNYTGDGGPYPNEADKWLKWMAANKISWANWSLCTKAEGSAFLKPTASMSGPWTDDDLTADGLLIKDKMR